jgi:predicted HTH transcriptional regulator
MKQKFYKLEDYNNSIFLNNPQGLQDKSFFRETLVCMDVWGRGSLNIIKALKERGLDKPLFEQAGGYFRIIFKRIERVGEKVKDNVPDNVPDKRKAEIITMIQSNNKIKISEISSQLKVNEKTIKRDIEILKQTGKIKRIGPQTGGRGYWEIIK